MFSDLLSFGRGGGIMDIACVSLSDVLTFSGGKVSEVTAVTVGGAVVELTCVGCVSTGGDDDDDISTGGALDVSTIGSGGADGVTGVVDEPSGGIVWLCVSVSAD